MAYIPPVFYDAPNPLTPLAAAFLNPVFAAIKTSFDASDASTAAAIVTAETYADAPPTSVSISGNYTFVLTDAGNVVLETVDAGAQTLTIPPASSVNFALGAMIEVARIGAGVPTFAAGAGVTIQSPGGALTIPTQYGVANLRKRATNTWHLVV